MNRGDRGLLELLDRRSLEQHLPSGKSILVAVSGGADSVALLRSLHTYAPVRSLCIAAVHVNHGLRPESDDEALFVEKLCSELGVKLYNRKLQLPPKPGGVSPEEFWRKQRYGAFTEAFMESNADFIALGHTADDLAETFLYHLARGTGPNGLVFHFRKDAGDLPIIRPLWKTRRAAIEQALRTVEQEWVNDPSNLDLNLSRNRIRSEVIPALEKINPAVVTAILNVADQLAEYPLTPNSLGDEDGDAPLDLDALRSSSRPAVRDAVRQFIHIRANVLVSTRHLDHAADMILEGKSGLVALPEASTLVITQTECWIYKGQDPENLDLAGEHIRKFGGFAADLSGQTLEPVAGHVDIDGIDFQRYDLHVTGAPGSYCIRNRKPGDRVGPRSLKKLLIDFMIPWYLRDYLVLAATPEGQVVAIASDNTALNGWVRNHARGSVELSYSIVNPAV